MMEVLSTNNQHIHPSINVNSQYRMGVDLRILAMSSWDILLESLDAPVFEMRAETGGAHFLVAPNPVLLFLSWGLNRQNQSPTQRTNDPFN